MAIALRKEQGKNDLPIFEDCHGQALSSDSSLLQRVTGLSLVLSNDETNSRVAVMLLRVFGNHLAGGDNRL